jgi:arylsulfatase A-like enzyme
MITRRGFLQTAGLSASYLVLGGLKPFAASPRKRPNILWIMAEDASPHLGCFGETAIKTPNLDALAAQGVKFSKAFVTCPVCSPCRSAFSTGVYQTTLGALHHRSQRKTGKGGGNEAYFSSYQLPADIPMISDLFRAAGYYTCNCRRTIMKREGKTDYNFINPTPPYDGFDWRQCPDGKPFFAQVQLSGGKDRSKKIESDDFTLPPYYPDHPVLREDWSNYLASWLRQDRDMGKIMSDLKQAGVLDNTIVFFLSDHGISHIRGKQFLYDEGIQVPLIVRFPDGSRAGEVRKDLVLQIDLAATSLALAGIQIPEHLQGVDLFAKKYKPRKFIVSARDRCDETIDIIRCVRTDRYKYIRNFMSYRPHMQESEYKDGKKIVKTMRQLHAEGKLNELQDRVFNPTRPPEELYDLRKDPFETVNLAEDKRYKKRVAKLRTTLYRWMDETGDLGLIPEPILDDMGRKYGSKYAIMKDETNTDLTKRLIRVIEAGERANLRVLHRLLVDGNPSERYWAATWLGHLRDQQFECPLRKAMTDKTAVVRVAAKLALCKLGYPDKYLRQLIPDINDENLIVGMYAMNAIEQTGILNDTVREAAELACNSKYEFTRRYGKRLMLKLQG